jgi:trimeric autotransporter adhesin
MYHRFVSRMLTGRSVFIAGFLILLFMFVFGYPNNSGLTESNKRSSALAPNLSATKTGVLDSTAGGDVNGNGFINPGDRLTYTVTINNSGADPATGVNFSDTIDANTTFVANSLIASPIAVNDSYNSIGNVGISVPDGANDLLGNDLDANNPGSSAALAITQVNGNVFVSGAVVSTTNGSVTINSNGSFTYLPNVGFEGNDTFTYALSNGTGLTDTSTVTITVGGMIWFINNNAASCTTIGAGCGTLAKPFSTLAVFNSANVGGGSNPDNNDNIFIYESGTAYSGAVTLRIGQKLIGQDATASLPTITGITVPPFSNALPATNSGNATITNLTSTVTLNTNTTLRGFSINSGGSTGVNDPA